ncbi:hypothetical protein ABE236_18115 [Priestia endophytica]|uniref:hypothetical protein n=1 Tax=Priestia endophytica TaxID=135735 RepID=UPI003D2D1761
MEGRFYVSNLPFEAFEELENGYLLKGIEAFKAGTWRGKQYSVENLQEMADNFKALKEENLLEPPMKVDHSESARDQIGWVQSLYVEGDALLADVLFTEKDAMEKVKRGTWKKVSAEIYSNYREESNNRSYGMVFRALSIVSIPQLKSIKGIVFNSESIEDEVTIEMTEEQMKALLDEKLAGLGENKVDFSELSTNLLDGFKSFYSDEVETYKEEAKKAKEDAAAMAKAVKANAIANEVKEYSETGKIVPAQEEALTELLGSFSEEQKEMFSKFMENVTDVDVEGEKSKFSEDKTDADLSPEEMAKKYLG